MGTKFDTLSGTILCMRLTILGCSGSVVSPTSPASCYLLQSEGHRPIILDIGNGAMGALEEIVNPSECDIVLSHMHPDHSADMSSMIVWRRYSHQASTRPAELYAPSSFPVRIGAWFADHEGEIANLEDTFNIHALEAGTSFDLNGFTVEPFQANHPGECFCFRFTEKSTGRTLAYSGDTGPCAGLANAAAGVDGFLCEATWTSAADMPENMHLTGTQAGEYAERAGVGKLLITHIPPWTDRNEILAEVTAACSAPTELVTPRAEYEW